ncbi:hypothetical protein [Micromonospora sp. NPDC050495]|uniref:hypothetical protein n=1 Tax=Micromonospora sp. NPDC050495 TaxID=3154936 RepID=UPI0033F7699B
MYAGLALTVAAMLLPFIDMFTVDSLTDHVRETYPDWSADLVSGDRNAIVIYLCAVGLLGIAGWIWAIRTVAKHKPAARVVTTVLFALGAGVALFDLTFYGDKYDRVLPAMYGIVGLLPSLAGLVTVCLVWLRPPSDVAASGR